MDRQADYFRDDEAGRNGQVAGGDAATVNGLLPETDAPLAATDAVTVSISRATLEILVLAADLMREHAKTVIAATPEIVGIDTLDVLAETGLIDPETLDPTQAFDLACVLGGIALGLDGGDDPEPDNGGGVDALAGDNDDFEDDVAVAETAFAPSPDPDWPGEPVPSVLDVLPRAASFGGD